MKSKPTSAIQAFEAQWRQVGQEDKPPPLAIDAMAYAKLHNITDRTAFMRLQTLARKGALETGVFKTKDSSNRLRSVRYFWPKKAKCSAAKR